MSARRFACCLFVALLPHSAHAQPFPVKVNRETVTLTFTSSADSAGCSFGEINAFSEEIAQGPKSFRLLLSLEPLEPSTLPGRWTDIGKFDLKKKFTTTFDVPRTATRSYYGVYICSDWEREDRCSGKRFAPVDRIFAGQDPTKKKVKLEGEPRQDETFYFVILVIDENGAELVRSRALPEDMRASLIKSGAPAEQLDELDRVLESFVDPVITAGSDGLELKFRYRDRELCE